MPDVKHFTDRYSELKKRGHLDEQWQDLAEVFMPNAADFTGEFSEGDRRHDELYDSTPEQARKMLSSSIDGLVKPKTVPWLKPRSQDEALNEDHDAKLWFDETGRRMLDAIYSRNARFIQSSGEVDDSLVTFGTGSLYTGKNKARNGLSFRSTHLKDTFIAENSDGQIDTEYVRLMRTPRQARQQFGEENLSKDTQLRIKDDKKKDEKIEFMWAVEPREDRRPRSKRNTDLPWTSTIIEVNEEHLVQDSGFKSFPFAVPRWETTAVSVYGRSPAQVAFPDALTLNQQAKTILMAGHKAVDPPMWAMDDAVVGAARTFPGGLTYLDGAAAQDIGGRPPMGVWDFGKNIPLGREMQNDTRDQIWRAFLKNVLQLPVDGPEMTATEVLERKEEFIRIIGPVFGRLETDYTGSIAERVFEIMQGAGQLPEPPDILVGSDVVFEFKSPIQAARRQTEVFGMVRAMEIMAPVIEFQPEINDNFDGDQMARDIPDIFGAPNKWLKTPEAVQALREQRAEEAAAQAAMEQAMQIADTGSQVIERMTNDQG